MLPKGYERRSHAGRAIGAGVESLARDLRASVRALTRAPAVSAVILATLTLAIGAHTAIFSIVHTMLVQPLPYREADRLVFVWLDRTVVGYPRGPMSGPDLGDLREGARSFVGLGAIWASGTVALEGDGEPEQLRAALVTTNFFQVLGADSALGRTFRADDSAPGAEPTILIGWELFQRRFGGDPSIVGRRVIVNDEPVTVIGVMPARFRLLLPPEASVPDRLQAWMPFWPNLEHGPRRNLFLRVIGRMRPGVTLAQARDDVASVARTISAEGGNPRSFVTVALQAENVREIRAPLLTLYAAVAMLLLVAGVNVASLLLARAATRGRETALRLALGATPGRLFRQWLVEGGLLALGGCLLGIVAAHVVLTGLFALTPDSLERFDASRIDGTVLSYTLGIALLSGVLFSLPPAVGLLNAGASSLQPHGRIGTTPRGQRARTVLVLAQVTLSVVLVVCAGLLARAFFEVLRLDPGFNTDHQLTFRLGIPDRYGARDAFNAFARDVQHQLAAIPGVTGAGAISHLPYDDLPNWALTFGTELPLPPTSPVADSRAVSPGLFDLLGARLEEGRFFTEDDDDPAHPVAIVNDRLARELWPNRSAVGQHLVTSVAGMNAPVEYEEPHARFRVIGVVRHLRLRSVIEEPRPQIFVPWRVAQRNPIAWVVGTGASGGGAGIRDPSELVSEIRRTVAGIDPRLAVYDVRPMQSYVAGARSMRRFTVVLATAFAAVAMALTLVGVYGMLAYAVAVRRPEFGVRAALGADAARLRRHVLGEGLTLAGAGGVAGVVTAAAGARLLESQLHGVDPWDPVTYVAAVVCVLGGALIACAIPAWRAARVSPMDALRSD